MFVFRRIAANLIGGAVSIVLVAIPTWADVTPVKSWRVSPAFAKNAEARSALSGAACVTATTKCLVVNDEKKYAQFFTMKGNTLVPGKVIRLLPDKIDGVEMDEIDAEAVSYAPPNSHDNKGYFYFTGSHGRSRKGELQASRFFLFRFPVSVTSGEPTFTFGDDFLAPEIERTALLRIVLKTHPDLAVYAEQPLEKQGITIEGLAIRGDELLLGLRAPSESGKAFVVRLLTKDLFGQEVPPASVLRVQLDAFSGIRDMAAVSAGFLLLSGQSIEPKKDGNAALASTQTAETSPTPALWFWDAKTEAARRLGSLPGVKPTDKAETLLVLEETSSTYRLLVMFDDVENGNPTEFVVSK